MPHPNTAPPPALPFAAAFGAAELPATMAMAARARALRDAGHPVINLCLGEPDFAPAPHILDAADHAARNGATKYPPVNGTPALRDAIARKCLRDHNMVVAPTDIVVGNGARQVIFGALMATLDPGTNIIVPAPYWNAYPLIARAAGATTQFVECTTQNDFLPAPDAIDAAISPQTRWLVLNFPNNPTGAVCPADHLAAIGAVLRRHPHVRIMADDMYEHLIHDGTPHVTIAQICPDLAPRTLTISGVSKTYAMTGFRVGFAAGPADLIAAITRVQGLATGGVCAIAQAASVAALDGPQDQVDIMRQTYASRATLVASHLNTVPGLICPSPRGAFYAFVNVTTWLGRTSAAGAPLTTDTAIATALLDENHLATVAGTAFGAPGHLRLSTAAATSDLVEACRRIARFAAGLS